MADDEMNLADEIARTGRLEVTRARQTASEWARWAVRLHLLAADMPAVGPEPKYMADDGIEAFLPFYIGGSDVTRMRARLTRVLRDADAVTGAWLRASTDVTDGSLAALRQVDADPIHYDSLNGLVGEAHG